MAQVWWFVDGKAPADMEKHLDKSGIGIEANQQFTCTENNGSFTYVSSCTATITPRGRAVLNGDEVVSKPNERADKGEESPAASSLHGPSLSSLENTSEATRQHVNTPESASNSSVMPSGPCENESPGGILGQVNQPEVPTGAKVETGTASITAFSAGTTVNQGFDKLAAEAFHNGGGGLQLRTHAPVVLTPNPHVASQPLSTPTSCHGHSQGNNPAEVSNFHRSYWCLWTQAV